MECSELMALAVPTAVGITAMAAQVIVMREVIALFNGNELSVGIVLSAWLLWTSIGSGLTGRLMRCAAHVRGSIAAVECLCGLSLADDMAPSQRKSVFADRGR